MIKVNSIDQLLLSIFIISCQCSAIQEMRVIAVNSILSGTSSTMLFIYDISSIGTTNSDLLRLRSQGPMRLWRATYYHPVLPTIDIRVSSQLPISLQ